MKKTMKLLVFIFLTIFLTFQINSCRKYDIIKENKKIKYYIYNEDTTEYFYDKSDKLIKLEIKRSIGDIRTIEYTYGINKIEEKITDYYKNEDFDTTYKNMLYPNELGLIERIIKNNDTIDCEYNTAGFLIKRGIINYKYEAGNITEIYLPYDTLQIFYSEKKNEDYTSEFLGKNYPGLDFYGKSPQNCFSYFLSRKYDTTYVFNFDYTNSNEIIVNKCYKNSVQTIEKIIYN